MKEWKLFWLTIEVAAFDRKLNDLRKAGKCFEQAEYGCMGKRKIWKLYAHSIKVVEQNLETWTFFGKCSSWQERIQRYKKVSLEFKAQAVEVDIGTINVVKFEWCLRT